MDAETMNALGKLGAGIAICLSAVGSVLGTGTAGMAAIGAWKKCQEHSKDNKLFVEAKNHLDFLQKK